MTTNKGGTSRRGHTRALLMQALYQQQLDDTELGELLAQFRERREYKRTDPEYFAEVLGEIMASLASLDEEIVRFADRPFAQLDLVEVGILRVGLQELRTHTEVPYRVVLNEAVELARRFGAEDSHKYINAILDAAAREHRAAECAARGAR